MTTTQTPTTPFEWATLLDEQIGTNWDAYSEAFSAGAAAGVGVTYEHPGYHDSERAYYSADGLWVARLTGSLWYGDYTVTDEQIAALRDEAGQAGDLDMVAICERALAGDDPARAECGRVIAEAE
jgi:hypothetical protein